MQRQQPPFNEHPPPGPSAPFGYYDRYGPPEEPIAPAFRDGFANEYNPNFWKPEPDFFPTPPPNVPFPVPPADNWQRPPGWRDPEPPAWNGPEPRDPPPLPLPPRGPQFPPVPKWNRRGGGPRHPPNRLFEPSDNWKQTHGEPNRGSPTYNSSQHPSERFRPYTPPNSNPNMMRNRFGNKHGPRHSFHGPQRQFHPPQPQPQPQQFQSQPLPYEEEQHWGPDEDLYGDSGPRDHRSTSFPNNSTSPDRPGRSDERSVSPASPRSAKHSSPGFGPGSFAPKRESPELPHLEVFPRKPMVISEANRIPIPAPLLPPKPPPRSPSRSSNASSVIPPQAQPPPVPPTQVQSPVGLPPKPPSQAESRQPISIPLPTNPSSKPPVPPVTSTVNKGDEQPSTAPSEVAQQKQVPPGPVLSGRSNTRRTFNAPSFVASTLAIDAPLMFPTRNGTSETVKGSEKSDKLSAGQSEDMDVSLPAPRIKAAQNTADVAAVSTQKPQPPASQLTVTSKVSDEAVDNDGDAADESDMDMSPPASPVIKATLLLAEPRSEDASSSDREISHPSLAVSSPQVTHSVPRQSSSASPVPTTPENADETAGDESDMEMSSNASDTAPSPPYEPPEELELLPPSVPLVAPPPAKLSLPQPPTLDDDSMVPGLTISAPESVPLPPSAPPSPPAEPPVVAPSTLVESSSVASSPGVTTVPLPTSVAPPTTRPVVQSAVASIPPAVPLTPTMTLREVSTQTSPLPALTTAETEKLHVETGELSPLASEETLREETESTADKDVDMTVVPEKGVHAAAAPEKVSVPQKEAVHDEDTHMAVLPEKESLPASVPEKRVYIPASEKVAPTASRNNVVAPTDEFGEKDIQNLPLSQALRLVAKLRFRHDPITQDARVEPILISNRQLAESEAASSPEPEPIPKVLLEKATEAGEQQHTDGVFGGTKHSLRKRFAQHQAALVDKVSRLRKEYLALHERWMVHCAKLDEIARACALEEAAATAGRTTRRTAAMGDAVRSDLEMEQILASLGNEELTDANHLSQKNAATIPDMVSVTKGRVEYIYDDTNNLVEDPHEFYKLETGIDDWTEQEKKVLVDKYAIHPKQFGIIADYIPNKSPAQCVTYYYLHKNTTIDFRKVIAQYNTIGKRTRRGRGGKQKGNALLTDILKHDEEVFGKRDGTPSTSGRRKRGAAGSSTPVPPANINAEPNESASTRKAPLSRRGTAQNTPDPTPTPDPEPNGQKRPRRRANLSAKAAAALEADGGDEPVEEERPAKRTRKARKTKAELEAEAAAAGDESQAPSTPVAETLFLKLLAQHGDDFKRIAASMANKTTIQVSAFYRSHSTEMNLSKVVAQAPKRSPTPHDKAHHGSHYATSSSSKAAIPATDSLARSKSSGRMSPPPNPNGSGDSSSAPPATVQPKGIPVPTYRPSAPYQGGIGSAFASTSRGNPNPLTSGLGGRPPTLTTSFPSAMAYSNLSPSNFAGQPPPPLGRGGPPGVVSGNNGSVMFEFSEFAPQPWQVPALTRPGGAPVIPGGGTGAQGAPAALETTDDLVRYLEHRTRLSSAAGQSNETDFM
uniref:Foldase protein PrsA 2 (EC) n=1 Tax=Ganoderma boninense TaxID=34458 RepID=A0A5K1JU94_9APHY|nr:Foldase protein PrsA 2 (EC [Ganoderma boninense]